jgi:galactonate dehydratase
VGACAGNVVLQEQSLGIHYHRGYSGLPEDELPDYLTEPSLLNPQGGVLPRLPGPGLGVTLSEDEVRAGAQDWSLPDPNWRLADGRLAEW